MNLRLLAWIVLPIVGLLLVGWIAVKLFVWALGAIFYIAIGAVVVAGAIYAYRKVRGSLGAGRSRRSLPR